MKFKIIIAIFSSLLCLPGHAMLQQASRAFTKQLGRTNSLLSKTSKFLAFGSFAKNQKSLLARYTTNSNQKDSFKKNYFSKDTFYDAGISAGICAGSAAAFALLMNEDQKQQKK